MSDACWLAPGSDAPIVLRALFERSELARAPKVRVCPIGCGQTGRQWFWVLFPKEKDLACRGETRQHRKMLGHWLFR
jgi:hypothetical protein